MTRKELMNRIFQKKSYLCIGLDTEVNKLPLHFPRDAGAVLDFHKAIIDATRAHCVAYKPNLAFFEALGPEGWGVFQKTVEYIGDQHFIIADAKRGDIGNTSRMYAEAFFQTYNCDAVTIAPYMGADSVKPFLGFPQKWAIVLGLTSNPGHVDFQTLALDEGGVLWEKVLQSIKSWGSPEELMFVIGATHPSAFERVRALVPEHFLLVPGVGTQGGDLEALSRIGLNADCGLLVNASRSIIYASNGLDFAEKAAEEALRLQRNMAELLSIYCNQQARQQS
jgi:orotidine-5'-phosphate decarboxylase